MIKRIVGVLLGAIVLISLLAGAASATTEHCPDHDGHPNKVEGSNNSFVPPADSQFCIKASNQATGMLTANGSTSLIDYVEQSGLRNPGGNVPDVSYYIIYKEQDSKDKCPTDSDKPGVEIPKDKKAEDFCYDPVEECPDGTVGTYPDCKVPDPNPEPCEYDDTLEADDPDCVPPVEECPEDMVGEYPDCKTPDPDPVLVEVCDVTSGEIIEVDEEDTGDYLPVNDQACVDEVDESKDPVLDVSAGYLVECVADDVKKITLTLRNDGTEGKDKDGNDIEGSATAVFEIGRFTQADESDITFEYITILAGDSATYTFEVVDGLEHFVVNVFDTPLIAATSVYTAVCAPEVPESEVPEVPEPETPEVPEVPETETPEVTKTPVTIAGPPTLAVVTKTPVTPSSSVSELPRTGSNDMIGYIILALSLMAAGGLALRIHRRSGTIRR